MQGEENNPDRKQIFQAGLMLAADDHNLAHEPHYGQEARQHVKPGAHRAGRLKVQCQPYADKSQKDGAYQADPPAEEMPAPERGGIAGKDSRYPLAHLHHGQKSDQSRDKGYTGHDALDGKQST